MKSMSDQRGDTRNDFIITEDDRDDTQNLQREEYYSRTSEVFRQKSIIPFVIGGLGLVVLVMMVVLLVASPENGPDQQYLQSLESRIRQLEQMLAATAETDRTLERLDRQEQNFSALDKKLNRLESTVTTQIDQIIKELGALHQKTAQGPAPVTAAAKKPVRTKKPESAAKYHQVQAGDTLYGIGRRYDLSVEQLRSYNNLGPNAAIYPGQRLRLSPDTRP